MKGEKSIRTPKSKISKALRLLWLRSRERTEALKQQKYTCQHCGVKQSKSKDNPVKIEVHHKTQVGNIDDIINLIYQKLLVPPEELQVLCVECHRKETYK